MANQYKNKVIYNGNTLIDISDTTAIASDVNSGKEIYLASGQKVTGTQAVYSVLKSLSHISASNVANKVIGNGTFYSELMPEEGYSITSVTVTMNGNDITDSVFTGYDGTVEGYSLTSSLTHCFFTDVETTKTSFYAVLNAELGYESPQVIITVGGVDMSNYYSSGVINIPNVTGNIVITAVAAQAVVSSITAVFTQGSAVIYDTDSLDTLKQYLVVTAHYENGTSGIVTGYTLSGTLTEGTSTITVSYGGKSTAFNVTVTETALYPIRDISNMKVSSDIMLSVSNGNHIALKTTANSRTCYIFSSYVKATYNPDFNTNTLFSIPAGATYEIKVKNISYSGNTEASNNFRLAVKASDSTGTTAAKSDSITIANTGDGTLSDVTNTATLETDSATNIGSIWFSVYRAVTLEFDVELRVNGVRYI